MAIEQPDWGEVFVSGPEQASQRLVLLHGWGADADDLLDLGELLVGPQVQVVSLRAPQLHPAGMGRQWYDLQQGGWPGLAPALGELRARLTALGSSVPLAQTVLLGFSQGAAMALDVASGGGEAERRPPGLAGVIGCSGYPHPDWQPAKPAESLALRVLLTHGEQDPVVPHGASVELQRLLTAAGATVELLSFAGGHSIDPDLFGPMRQFLARCWA
ncbi:MAG: esterase [Cyanobacteria bacterium K_DeepCast_35m_m2_023]|nr:esterase [Cyanobacteria bacterium K_DeepCast_35m_m2_023]